MKYVICDTMIWYYLGSGKIQRPPKDKCKLIATSVSIRELGVTPNIRKSRIEVLRTAVNAIIKYADLYVLTNPFDYIVNHFENDSNSTDNAEKELLNKFRSMQMMNVSEITDGIWEEIRNKIDNIRIPIQLEVDRINKEVLTKRIAIRKENFTTAQYRKLDLSFQTKEYICDLINHFSKEELNKVINIEPNDTRWSEFEIFLSAWEIFHKELNIGSEKLKQNDWSDLFNMVYLKTNMKYWTEDQKWHRIFNLSKKLDDIMFNF